MKNYLIDYFEKGCKNKEFKRYGIELEHIIVDDTNLNSITYHEHGGIKDILTSLNQIYHGKPYLVNDELVGFECECFNVTIEPAGQIEISISPIRDLRRIEKIYDEFRTNLDDVLKSFNCIALTLPYMPKSKAQEMELIPSNRYHFMDEYFKQSGSKGVNMMRGSASLQISLDYESEEDFVREYRLTNMLMPLLMLVGDNSQYFESQLYHKHLLRYDIWRNCDNDRCGIIPQLFNDDFSFATYCDYLLDLPLIYHDNKLTKESCRLLNGDKELMKQAIGLSFLDVRLKNYIEVRYLDSMPLKIGLGFAALLGTIFEHDLYDQVCNILNVQTVAEIEEACIAITFKGYDANVYQQKASVILDKLNELIMKNIDEDNYKYYHHLNYLIKNHLTLADLDKLKYEYLNQTNYEQLDKVNHYLANSSVNYQNHYIKTLASPKFYEKRIVNEFEKIVDTTYQIASKVINEYLNNKEYRKLFKFSKQCEDLILIERDYQSIMPIARFDIFYEESSGDFKFCEINTDGTSTMNENYELNLGLLESNTYKELNDKMYFQTYELFDSFTQTFLKIYQTYENKVDNPYIVITDFLEKATLPEFERFKTSFINAGYDCDIVDIRSLIFKDNKLYTDQDKQVNAIYRRAVTSDILNNLDSCSDFIKGVKSKSCAILGHFCTQVIHNKIFFVILRDEMTKRLLSDEENEFVEKHILVTGLINNESKAMVKTNKDKYIIKPLDMYATSGVKVGSVTNSEEWDKFVDKLDDDEYIYQEYYWPYRSLNKDDKYTYYYNLTGLYVYDGLFKGIYSRVSPNMIIADQYGGRELATLIYEKKD